MDPVQIAEEVAAELERIAGICSVSLTQAGALLKFFRYDAEKLMERFFEGNQKTQIEKEKEQQRFVIYSFSSAFCYVVRS